MSKRERERTICECRGRCRKSQHDWFEEKMGDEVLRLLEEARGRISTNNENRSNYCNTFSACSMCWAPDLQTEKEDNYIVWGTKFVIACHNNNDIFLTIDILILSSSLKNFIERCIHFQLRRKDSLTFTLYKWSLDMDIIVEKLSYKHHLSMKKAVWEIVQIKERCKDCGQSCDGR